MRNLCSMNSFPKCSHIRRVIIRKLRPITIVALFILLITIFMRRNLATNVILNDESYEWFYHMERSLKGDSINLAVIEEHHEAIPYWFAARNKGILQQTGNILIHIDAHSDTAVPAYHVDGFASNKSNSPLDIHSLMLSNDDFVLGAVYKSLIDTIIWVYPDWTSPAEAGPNSSLGQYSMLHVGHYTRWLFMTGNCACVETDEGEELICTYVDSLGYKAGGLHGECVIVKKVKVHYLNAAVAPVYIPLLMEERQGNGGNISVILDIDEDFYGVMKGSEMLESIDYKDISKFDAILSESFDIKSFYDEEAAHLLLSELLHLISTNCSYVQTGRISCTPSQTKTIHQQMKNMQHIKMNIGDRELSEDILQTIVSFAASQFSIRQLDIIRNVGFCLVTSTRTFRLVEKHKDLGYHSISVCHGRNGPDTSNQIMVPEISKLPSLTKALEHVFQVLPANLIRLMTLCRSNRDGYTPRHLQRPIEKQIIELIKQYFTNVNIIYDPMLMFHL